MAKRKTVGGEIGKGTRVSVSRSDEVTNPVLSAWVRAGIVTLPRRAKTPTPASPVRLAKGAAARLLDEDRRGRGRL